MSSSGITGFDPSILLNYFNVRAAQAASTNVFARPPSSASSSSSSTGNSIVNSSTPWDSSNVIAPELQDSQSLANTPFLDLSSDAIRGSATTDAAKANQDTEKLFALYKGLDRLSYLAAMGARDTTSDGQLPGLNTRFQAGLAEVQKFMNTATFNNFTLLTGDKTSSIASSAAVPPSATTYMGGVVAKGKALFQPVPNLSTSDSFKITVTKGGVATDVNIDLSQVSGPLTLDNISSYVNTQLSDAGFSTRIRRVVIDDGSDAAAAAAEAAKKSTSGTTTPSSVDPITYETFGLQIKTTGAEKLSFSAAAAQPAIYLAGSTGTTAAGDQQGRLTKLIDLNGTQRSEFSQNITPDDGTATAQSTVVDGQGNVYVLGTTTGSFGGQLEKGTSDVYLTKYDSAGNKLWTRLAGSEASAQGYSLALDPTGGVVIAGTTTGELSQTAVGGNGDAFVAKYTGDGTQKWLHQVSPLSKDGAFSVSVDGTGSVYVGGQVTGTLAAGQTNNGGGDATITKLDSTGKVVYRQQFGTAGADQVSQVANTSDGGLVVASVQNGHAVVSKYANGDATGAALWTYDLGDLKSGGTIGGIAVDGDKVYVSGTTTNTALNAGGQASTVHASSGGSDAFVFRLDDAGSTATANYVTYVGTSNTDKGAGIAVSAGKVYLTGTTKGVFAGQTQSFANTENMFVTQLDQDGSVDWSKQYGGVEGTSSGAGIAVDPNGASVLDALGLPRGNISLSQSVNLVDQTTVREGDSFKLQVSALGVSNTTIRIAKNETMSSLATKINTYLGTKGKASVTYNKNGAALRISVNAGVEVKLSSGPTGSDALAGLGIDPGLIVKDPSTKNGVPNTNWAKQLPVYGLSMPKTDMDISTKDGTKAARAQLLAVEGALRTAYRKINTPVTTAFTNTQSGQAAPAYLTSQLGTYNLALSMLGGGTTA